MESLLAWDQSAFLAINHGLGTRALDEVMLSFTYLADALPLAAILLACGFIGDRRGAKRRLLFLLMGVLSGALLVHAAKLAVGRPRPIATLGDKVRAVGAPPRGRASWPSGHTQAAFGAAVVLAELFRRLRWPLLAVAALVGLSRIYVGAHFPLDVIAGMVIGVLAGIATIAVGRRFLLPSARV
jgi:undecaprenyl-diphosphatase